MRKEGKIKGKSKEGAEYIGFIYQLISSSDWSFKVFFFLLLFFSRNNTVVRKTAFLDWQQRIVPIEMARRNIRREKEKFRECFSDRL